MYAKATGQGLRKRLKETFLNLIITLYFVLDVIHLTRVSSEDLTQHKHQVNPFLTQSFAEIRRGFFFFASSGTP